MTSSVTSSAMVGVTPRPVRIEATVVGGQAGFSIVGLPDTAVREARERVRAAIRTQGYRFPTGKVIVNLSPADIPKAGSTYDLPIALAILGSAFEEPLDFGAFVAVGELSLGGDVRPVRAALGAIEVARREARTCLLPVGTVLDGDPRGVVGVGTLREAVSVVRGRSRGSGITRAERTGTPGAELALVRGQPAARRALEIAAAGGHHLLMTGPPGAGKTMLARCVPSILPRLPERLEREVALVWSAAGLDRTDPGIPPFRAPHHSSSLPALVGGGVGFPRPGEVSKAHHGVLFLDELGEFPPAILDALRQPIEDGSISIARSEGAISLPARIQIVAATNPCPCGFDGDHRTPCRCGDAAKDRYRRRLSGPLVDRFDVRVRVARLRPSEMTGPAGEPSAAVLARVVAARKRQLERGGLNRDLGGMSLDTVPMTDAADARLVALADADDITGRGWNRVRRVARTIADLAESEVVTADHVDEAVEFRGTGT